MKHAYVSLVLLVEAIPDALTIETLDAALATKARAHELVIVAPHGSSKLSAVAEGNIAVHGPVSLVTTQLRSTLDGAIVAGLARSVGDFIIEWRGPLDALNDVLIGDVLAPSDEGAELVEVVGYRRSLASRFFNRVVNSLRPRDAPLRRTIARVYSRYAVQSVLRAATFEPHLDVLVAELPVQRTLHPVPLAYPPHAPITQRLSHGFSLLAKGTRFGSTVPLLLAAVSTVVGAGAAFYAFGLLVLRGRTPEGWTTLMVVIGFGQAAILTMLGLTWARVDSLSKSLARNSDMTAAVEVLAPTRPNHISGPPKVVEGGRA